METPKEIIARFEMDHGCAFAFKGVLVKMIRYAQNNALDYAAEKALAKFEISEIDDTLSPIVWKESILKLKRGTYEDNKMY